MGAGAVGAERGRWVLVAKAMMACAAKTMWLWSL